VDGTGRDDSKTAEKMRETRKRRVKKGRRRIVVTSRKMKRVGITKSQPMKNQPLLRNTVNLKRSWRRANTI